MADGSDIGGLRNYLSSSTAAAAAGIIIVFLMICGIIASLYAGAISGANMSTVKKCVQAGSKKAGKAEKILDNERKYLVSAYTAALLCDSAVSAAFSYLLYPCVYRAVYFIPDSAAACVPAAVLSFIIVFVICTGLLILTPQKLGYILADRIVVSASGIFSALRICLMPVIFPVSLISDIIPLFFGKNTGKGSNQLTEDEIMLMVDEGEENGFIEGNTKDMIENVFEFDDTTVGEIMTHRRDVVAVKDDAKITDVVETAIRSGRSRLPVYHDDIDDITGMIHVKDLLRFVSTNAPTRRIGKDIIKDVVFVPEAKRCSEMFEYMTSHRIQIAVVVDEFGGTGGIITMEDLIESIVGSIQDEYDNEDEDIKKLGENRFTVDGATPLDEISELTGTEINDGENDTIAGFLLDRIGHIPKNSEHPTVSSGNVRFIVQEVENRRISKVLVVTDNKNEKDQKQE